MLITFSTRIPANGHKYFTIRQTTIRVVLDLRSILIFVGIIGIAAALIVDMLEISTGTAIAMSCVFTVGVALCFFTWALGFSGRTAIWDAIWGSAVLW